MSNAQSTYGKLMKIMHQSMNITIFYHTAPADDHHLHRNVENIHKIFVTNGRNCTGTFIYGAIQTDHCSL